MSRRLALTLLPLALLAAACIGGGGDSRDEVTQQEATDRPAAVSDPATHDVTQQEAAEPPAAISDSSTDEGESDAGDVLLDTVNPFQFLGGLNGQAISGEVDPNLKRALLEADDLPADFFSLGQFTFSLASDVSDVGEIEMVASQFISGDLAGGEFGAMVMSAVMAVPPEALDEFGDLNELKNLSQADLDALQAEAGQLGADFRLLDADGLGETGFAMHMEMDFSGLFGALGAAQEDAPFEGIAIDIYVFLRKEHLLMLMVMWPTDQPPGVDARNLAETMDGKAGAF